MRSLLWFSRSVISTGGKNLTFPARCTTKISRFARTDAMTHDWGKTRPRGWWGNQNDRAVVLQNTVDGSIWGETYPGFTQFLLDGRSANLCEWFRFKSPSDFYDSLLFNLGNSCWAIVGRFGLILESIFLPCLVTSQPLEKPLLGTIEICVTGISDLKVNPAWKFLSGMGCPSS